MYPCNLLVVLSCLRQTPCTCCNDVNRVVNDVATWLEQTGRYAAAVVTVAQAHDVPVVNLWELFQKDAGWRDFLSDGLHLSESGNRALYSIQCQ